MTSSITASDWQAKADRGGPDDRPGWDARRASLLAVPNERETICVVPPCLDVYVRLRGLDRAMIEAFLGKYLPDYRDPELWLVEEPVAQLAQGVGGTARGFALYSRSPTAGPHDSVIVAFPHDGGAVLGLSVDMDPEERDASEVAEGLLTQLLDETHADEGFIGAEEPPPLSAADWRKAMEEPAISSVRRHP